jgi:hypothetical protein
MAGNPFYQNLDPMAAPDPVTPQASPGDPAGFAMVTPSGRGTAPYDIQADLGAIEATMQAGYDEAGLSAAAGVAAYHMQGARQREAEQLLDSPAGFSAGGGLSGFDITTGWSGESALRWPNNVQASEILETPAQGQMGTYPSSTSTLQEGLQKYGTS